MTIANPPPPPPVFGGGLWLWYVPAFRAVTAAQMATDAASVGAAGVIVHQVGGAALTLRWLASPANARALAGLRLGVAIGSMGKDPWDQHLASPAIAALQAGYPVMLDAESAWDKPGGRDAAVKVVDKILGAVPDAVGHVADCAWWRPHSHPGFPFREFGTLCATRYPQCYPEVSDATGVQADGGAAACLHTARAEYPPRGSPATSVYPTVRGYVRSARDACKLALDEPHQLLYLGSHANRMTDAVRAGLLAAKRVREAGGVAAWQRAHGLVPDALVGHKTLASLGL